MATVIPVRFAYAARDLWFDPGQTGAMEGDHLICSTERGTEIGLATADAYEVSNAELGRRTSGVKLKPVLRVATEEDLDRAERLAQMGDEALPTFRRLAQQGGLDMKPVGVEYLFGRERVVCYFAAEERVDFRQLVRSLSHELHERIDMRQIGVREEAAVIGGFGHCGQELCCARIGLSFEPVSIRMAKEQDLPLTSNKISGACGRLMCCLRYEFEAYRDFKSRAPKRNAVIDTPLGKAKIVEYDTPKEQLALRIENGKVVRIPLAEMVASEAAVKKSEELHCPCRPDTVVRESLDKLSSPDVQMALAELDRKMGVVKDEDLGTDDLFVDAKPRKRRSRRGSGQAGAEGADGQGAQGETTTATTRRRRRRRTAASAADGTEGAQDAQAASQDGEVAEAQGQVQAQGQGPAQGQGSRRRRRRRRSGSGGQGATGGAGAQEQGAQSSAAPDAQGGQSSAAGGEQPKPRRRRRHRSGSGSQAQGGQQTQGGQQAQGQAQGQQQPKRRPGDRGGQAQQAQAQGEAQQDAPKRRRRRRGGRGRGGQGNQPPASE